ncbi:MAG: phosphotransferase [Dermatophilus congolensis]|nr:phosphotransferase [Dermatophilus congolensis]
MTIDPAEEFVRLPTEEQARRDDIVSAEALGHYGFSDQVKHELITLSENATYRVDDPGTGRTGILRVHRQDYHSLRSILSELDWIAALHDSPVNTNTTVPTETGDRVYVTEVDGAERYAVMFEVMPGVEPDGTVLHPTSFRTLGAITAQLHLHSKGWTPPAGFRRFSWDWSNTLGDEPRWGRWQDGIGIEGRDLQLFGEAAGLIRDRLETYGNGPERFGLVHADLRLANLLVEGERVNVIDFDDCGYSWFMYDFGTAVSFIEHDPRLPEWQQAWLEGYRSVTDLSQIDEDMLATFVMLRRLLLVAWMGSHSHAREVQAQGATYTAETRDLARTYLDTSGARVM